MTGLAKRRIAAAIALLTLAAPAWSAQYTLDFRQAADMALRQNPDMLAAQAQEAQARAGVAQAQAARWPKVTLGAGVTRSNDALNAFGMKLSQRRATFNDFGSGQFLQALNSGVSPLGIAPANLNDPAPVNDFNTQLQAELPLYTGGKLQGYAQQARAMLLAAQAGDQAARQQIIAHVLEAYDGVHTARAYRDVAQQAVQAAQAQFDTAEQLYRAGVVIKSDVLSAQVNLEQIKLQQRQADDMLEQAMDGLHVVLGLPLSDTITLEAPVQVSMPTGEPAQWLEQAQQANPQLQALRHQVEATDGKVRVARADLYPQIGAMARYDTHDPNAGFGAHSYTIGAQLRWTVFDAGVARDGVDQAQAERMQAQARLNSAQYQLGAQIRASYRQALDAQQQLATRELAVQQAQEAARIVAKRYADGVGTLVEMQGAQAQLDKARAELVQARERMNMQRAALRLALGRLGLNDLDAGS